MNAEGNANDISASSLDIVESVSAIEKSRHWNSIDQSRRFHLEGSCDHLTRISGNCQTSLFCSPAAVKVSEVSAVLSSLSLPHPRVLPLQMFNNNFGKLASGKSVCLMETVKSYF